MRTPQCASMPFLPPSLPPNHLRSPVCNDHKLPAMSQTRAATLRCCSTPGSKGGHAVARSAALGHQPFAAGKTKLWPLLDGLWAQRISCAAPLHTPAQPPTCPSCGHPLHYHTVQRQLPSRQPTTAGRPATPSSLIPSRSAHRLTRYPCLCSRACPPRRPASTHAAIPSTATHPGTASPAPHAPPPPTDSPRSGTAPHTCPPARPSPCPAACWPGSAWSTSPACS